MSCSTPAIVIGDDWSRSFTYQRESDSEAIAIDIGATVRAAIVSKGTRSVLAGPVACAHDADGADWPNGVVVVALSSVDTAGLSAGICELELEVDDGGKSTVHLMVRAVKGGIT